MRGRAPMAEVEAEREVMGMDTVPYARVRVTCGHADACRAHRLVRKIKAPQIKCRLVRL